MTEIKGSCLCAEVAYQLEGEILAFLHCHCQRCRKMTGTGHASNLRVETDTIHWLKGESLIASYSVPGAFRFRNDFCSACGSPLPRFFEQTGYVLVPAGTLDTEPGVKPQARIFSNSRAEWSCSDELTEYEEYPV